MSDNQSNSQTPTIADLMTHVAEKTPTKWYEVGIQLNIELSTLDAFEQQTTDQMRLYSKVFNQWKTEQKLPYTWDTIINALEKVRENETVKDIRKWLKGLPSSDPSCSTIPVITPAITPLPADAVQHGPVTVLVKPGVSERLLFLLEEYANMLCVLRAIKLSNEKFCILKYFLSDLLDEKSIPHCLTICDVINFLKEQLRIHPFNIYILKVSCKHLCSSEVTDSLQQYKLQLDEFLSNTSVKDFKESLNTQLPHSSKVESLTLKLDESWMDNTLKALERLVYHFFGNCSNALVLSETRAGCVCVTWIFPTSMVPNLRTILQPKQLSPEYLMSKGVLEFVIGLRIAPNEALLSGQLTGALESASDSHTELGNEEQHGMIQQMMRVREQINLDLENKTGILQKQNVMLESELREIRKEKMDFEKNLEELELKCKQQCFHLEEKCKELENDVEMFKQKGSTTQTTHTVTREVQQRTIIEDFQDILKAKDEEIKAKDKGISLLNNLLLVARAESDGLNVPSWTGFNEEIHRIQGLYRDISQPTEADQDMLKKPLLVIPVVGPQNSGKTDLLNAMIGGSIVHRFNTYPIYVQHDAKRHLFCDKMPCQNCVRVVSSLTGDVLSQGMSNIFTFQEKNQPVDGEYYIIQTNIPMLKHLPEEFPFTVYLADCPGDNIHRLMKNIKGLLHYMPAVICTFKSDDCIDDREETVKKLGSSFLVFPLLAGLNPEVPVIFAINSCRHYYRKGPGQDYAKFQSVLYSNDGIQSDLLKICPPQNPHWHFAVADKWALKARMFENEGHNAYDKLKKHLKGAWKWVKEDNEYIHERLINTKEIIKLTIGLMEKRLWDLITNESEALNWLGQKVQAPQIQPEDTSEMKKEEVSLQRSIHLSDTV